tara:strand:+ start:938 stop:1111 length:174 start_codon:yes stop_codon:yes gene_type:complete
LSYSYAQATANLLSVNGLAPITPFALVTAKAKLLLIAAAIGNAVFNPGLFLAASRAF